MADSAPKVAEAEREEPADVLDEKVDALVKLIQKSKHFIVCTGAGVSTSAGIADFRGPNGVWTLRAQGKQAHNRKSTLQTIPTPTHMALVELQNHGILSYLINFRAVSTYKKSIHDHRTGRNCAICGGILLDTIINFGENLFEEPLRLARKHAATADLCLVLGSSLTVSPSNEIPETVGRRRGAKLIICNLQSTPIDHLTSIRIFTKTDNLLTRVMAKLDLPIPSFILRRRLAIQIETGEDKRQQLTVRGIDVDGTPATFLQSVRLDYSRRVVRSEPFVFNLRCPEPGTQMKLELEFMGHYNEPNLEVQYSYEDGSNTEAHYLLEYNPNDGNWVVTQSETPCLDDSARNEVTENEKVVIDLTND
ncbi:hypothetical protein GQX73_g7091 [Xylaria multiplex]|uniref:protein acetyllysine N-acetyltransferase n=1 Tax=Xylaria multiplex TaxID=323545 RepID=A0A7C8MVD5_9PEZI|nr:hypothetical protein GQX73_g7091 [Xylaria multiplex]